MLAVIAGQSQDLTGVGDGSLELQGVQRLPGSRCVARNGHREDLFGRGQGLLAALEETARGTKELGPSPLSSQRRQISDSALVYRAQLWAGL